MKTPREILLARHQAAAPKLDAIRRAVVAELNHQNPKTPSWITSLVSWSLGSFNKTWQELVWPCRRIWTGLAAVWVLLFIVNVSQRDRSHLVQAKPATAGMMMSYHDQQKLLNELFADRSQPADAEPPKTFSPKPRTETLIIFAA